MPAIPTKLFDVRNGNQCVDSDGTVYQRATIIVFKDNSSKDAMIDAICKYSGYQNKTTDSEGNTIPNPVNKQSHYNKWIQNILREKYKSIKANDAANAAIVTANQTSDNELPPE